MTPEEFNLMKPLVDTQPVYNLMLVAQSPEDSIHSPEVRAFAKYKLREAMGQMRQAAKYIEERIGKKDTFKK